MHNIFYFPNNDDCQNLLNVQFTHFRPLCYVIKWKFTLSPKLWKFGGLVAHSLILFGCLAMTAIQFIFCTQRLLQKEINTHSTEMPMTWRYMPQLTICHISPIGALGEKQLEKAGLSVRDYVLNSNYAPHLESPWGNYTAEILWDKLTAESKK